ncbi:hypothetical protein SETIT_2G180100v2 [Setaria italica]|uniref:cysteine desulfurase n=1 Tax=Setaria italica TaxID=4555 RepID=K3ZTN8_SETIT|nr:hypothetical protein SETIT_2G180100v2 [Setaria italica]RCV11368.1 hypothetical protein SETIT_2G180100v2 [Setaria italica]
MKRSPSPSRACAFRAARSTWTCRRRPPWTRACSTPCSPSTSPATGTRTPAPTSTAGSPTPPSRRPAPASPPSSAPTRVRSSSPPAPPSATTSPSRALCASTATAAATSSPRRPSTSASSTPAATCSRRGSRSPTSPSAATGLVDLAQLEDAIRPDTGLVSVMAVNNEIGVVQPLEEIGRICKEKGVPFHTDAAQALGKIPIDVNRMGIGLMSLSGHKIYGPKGVGALYLRRRPRIRVEPQMSGGGQERGIRSGTVPTPLVVGFGAACEIAAQEMDYDHRWVNALQQRLLDGIRAQVDEVVINGSMEHRYPGNLNLSFAYVEGESLLMGLKEVAVSSGSACTSASLEPSYVLRALGVEEDMAHTSIRFGIGRFTTEEEVDRAIELTVRQVKKLRDMSPLYELAKAGIDLKSIEWSQH